MNSFTLEDSREIQDKLKANKATYDAFRLQEWQERKHMKQEDEKLRAIYLKESSKREENRMEDEAREIREAEMNEKWKKHMLENEIEKQQIIQQLTEAAVLRGSKKKSKKRVAKPKK